MSALAVVGAASGLSASGRKISELVKGPLYYQCGNLAVQRGIPDVALADLYVRLLREGVMGYLYYEGQPPCLRGFLDEFMKPEANTMGLYIEDEKTLQWQLVGFAWINKLIAIGPLFCAQVGEGFVRHLKTSDVLLLVQLVIEWGFDNLKIEALHGVTPIKNRAACIFPRKIGFQIVGPLEGGTVWRGELCDTQLCSMTRSRWAKVRPWKE